MPLDFINETDDIYVDLGTLDLPVGLSNASFTAWFLVRNFFVGQEQRIINKADGNGINASDWLMMVEETGDEKLRYGLRTDLDGADAERSVSSVQLNVWTFGAFTYDGVIRRFYFNGIEEITKLKTGVITTGTGRPTLIGAVDKQIGGPGTTGIRKQFDGLLDDIRIYARTLSPAELLTMFTLRGKDDII